MNSLKTPKENETIVIKNYDYKLFFNYNIERDKNFMDSSESFLNDIHIHNTTINSKLKEFIYENLKISEVNFSIFPSLKEIDINIDEEAVRIFSKKKKRILIVDDNKYIRQAIKNLVRSSVEERKQTEDFEILEGNDGVDILKYVIYDQINNSIKCILTDENMEYLNGSEAIKILRNLEKHNKIKYINITSITSFEDNYTINSITSAGADLIVGKPVTKKKLMEIFDNINLFDLLFKQKK